MREAPRSGGKTLFGLHLHFAGRCFETPQVPGALRNVNPAQVSMRNKYKVSKRNNLLHHFS